MHILFDFCDNGRYITMKVFRFMSNEEFEKYNAGKTLTNKTKHYRNTNTNSKGFCFLDLEEYAPEYAIHFLSGLVSTDICAIFEVDEKELIKSWGKYAKPIQNIKELFANWFEGFIANEYCATKYSKEKFKLIKHTKPVLFDFDYKNWDWEDN